MRTAEVENATPEAFWIAPSASKPQAARMMAATQAAKNARMIRSFPGSGLINVMFVGAPRQRSGTALRHALGFGRVFRRVDVEEWIDRFGPPVGERHAVSFRPRFDLAQAGAEGAAQIVPQRDRPEPHHGMPPFARARTGEGKLFCQPRGMQPRDEIARQERAVAGHAEHPL